MKCNRTEFKLKLFILILSLSLPKRPEAYNHILVLRRRKTSFAIQGRSKLVKIRIYRLQYSDPSQPHGHWLLLHVSPHQKNFWCKRVMREATIMIHDDSDCSSLSHRYPRLKLRTGTRFIVQYKLALSAFYKHFDVPAVCRSCPSHGSLVVTEVCYP